MTSYAKQIYFRLFRQIAETRACHVLENRRLPMPDFFNWTPQILEGLHMAAAPPRTQTQHL